MMHSSAAGTIARMVLRIASRHDRLSALKFAIVVAFYMHLKYDHKLFRALFTGPLIIAMSTLLALFALFSHRAIPQ